MRLSDDSGSVRDATAEVSGGAPGICIVFESRGGSRRLPGSLRNTDDMPALERIFCRMARLKVRITDAVVASAKAMPTLAKEDRRLPVLGAPLPILLTEPPQANDLARRFRQTTAGIGRNPNARGRGNPTKRIETPFALTEPTDRSDQSIVDHLFGSAAAV